MAKVLPKIKDPANTLIVMEGTGGYEGTLVDLLHQANLTLAIVNPRRVRDFAKGIGWDAKTDLIDAKLIAHYDEVVKPKPHLVKTSQEKKLEALVTRRRQLLGLINQENNRLQQTRDQEIQQWIRQSLKILKKQVQEIEQRISQAVAADKKTLARSKSFHR